MQDRSVATRAALLSAALHCFAESGYQAASVAAICDRAGLSKGAFYHHFPSKQAIFLELLQGWLTGIQGGLQAVQAPNARQGLLEMADLLPAVLEGAGDSLSLFLEFLVQARRDPQIWSAVVAPYQHYQQFFAERLRAGQQDGSLPADLPVENTARLIVALAVGLLLHGLFTPEQADWQELARQGLEALLGSEETAA